jgi:single-stranded-DNA-specific exonuclease
MTVGMRSLERTTWVVAPPDAEAAALASALEVSPLVAALLRRRGATTVEAARRFLRPRLEDLSDPLARDGMAEAVEVVQRALGEGRRIAIHGDYDADGISATAILVRGLRDLGGDPLWYLPHRFRDGYGLGGKAVDLLADRGAGLLVAVDCGITAHDAVARARRRGLEVVILDHHEPQSVRPPATIVEGAPRGEGAGGELCAAGLAFVFLWALRRRREEMPALPAEMAPLAALGTIADLVPLRGDNRILAAAGLERMRAAPPIALAALAEEAGLEGSWGAWQISWQFAPRLNAPGRLGDPTPALDLLLADDPDRARDLAGALEQANRERQEILARVLTEAVAQAEEDPDAPALVLAGENWHPGVVGLVASRLVEQYRRPAVVIALAEGSGRGSARSVEGFHLVQALETCRDHLAGFGGHAMAAGLSLARDAVEEFRRCFRAAAAGAPSAGPERIWVDAELTLADLTTRLVSEMAGLGPFGPQNPEPVLAVRGVRAVTRRLVGDGAHLRIGVTDGTRFIEAIGFEMAERGEVLTFVDAPVDLAFTPELDRFDPGRVRMRLRGLEVAGVDPETVLTDTGLLVDRLFRRAADYLSEARYDGAEDAPALYTKVVGVTFEGRQAVLAGLHPGDPLRLVREPSNPHDPHAVRVGTEDGRVVGYLSAQLAARLAPSVDAGARYRATAVALTGGGDRTLGLNVYLEREEDVLGTASLGAGRPPLPGALLRERLPIYLNGGRPFPPSSARALAAVAGGRSALLALPPLRGRAMVIAGAAALAAATGQWALVVCPLRSLVEHRAEQIAHRLAPLGIRVVPVHGLLGVRDRERTAAALRRGDVNVVVCSAEAVLASDLLAPSLGRVAAVVLDLGAEDALPLLPPRLAGCPVLAVARRASREMLAGLPAGASVIADEGRAADLRIVDRRGGGERDAVVEEVASRAEKIVVYATRRDEAVRLAAHLRERLPDRTSRIGYLHGGLPVRVRRVIAQAFREGRLDALVATSALDEEGLPPDVREVVVASLPFTRERFLAACASAGGAIGPATLTLAFGPADVDANRRTLDERAPGRSLLAAIYRILREWRGEAPFFWPDDETWVRVSGAVPHAARATVAAACAIFEETGLAARESVDGRWQVQLLPVGGRRDLDVSLRYREGRREREAFDAFARWIQAASAQEILRAVLGRDAAP